MGQTEKPKVRPKDLDSEHFQDVLYSFVSSEIASNQVRRAFEERVKKNHDFISIDNSSEEKAVDVVIVVAVPDEKDGVNNAFGVPRGSPRSLDLMDKYRFGYHLLEQDGLSIALLIQPGMGMTQSSSLATRAILAFKPKLIAMVGICAGRKEKTNLGDIIIASSVFDYTAGKQYVDRFGPRPQSHPFDTAISEYIAASVIENHELVGKIIDSYQGVKPTHQVKIHFKPIASGTAVVDDPEIVSEIVKTQDDLAGIDMEAYALAVAANILRTKWMVVKSVQDFADGEKSQTETGMRPFAAYASAKLMQLIINELWMYM